MTDKTPAMPELPEPEIGYIETDKSRQPAFSARQMREALQPAQPAEVSDAELRKAIDALRNPGTVSTFYNGFYTLTPDELRRAILALRPQAVPMTEEQIVAALKACDREDPSKEGWIWRTRIKWARAVEAHHGITAQGAQEGV